MAEQVVYFREEQRFTQWWVWLLIAVSVVPIWIAFFGLLGQDESEIAANLLLWVFFLALGIGLPIFMYALKMTVEVREDHIYVRFFPLTTRKFLFSEIERYYARQYQVIREYGGWGVRAGMPGSKMGGKAYNVKGDWGVQLEMRDGNKVLIGSQQADEFVQALDSVMR